jgi:type II secretory pathway pseudopilin PulG
MITMAIIIVLVTVALPNIMGALTTKPIDNARNRVINLFQAASTRSANDFNAYGVAIDPTTLGGMLTLHQGTSPSCASINWNDRISTVLFSAPLGTGIDPDFEIDISDPTRQVEVRLIAHLPAGVQQVCFSPDGRFLDANTNQPLPTTDGCQAPGEYIVSLATFDRGIAMGAPVHVIISPSGKGRFVFGADACSDSGEGGS